MAVAREQVAIGAAQRAEQQAVAHRASVDEQILLARLGAVESRQAGEAGNDGAAALAGDGRRVVGELVAHDAAQPREAGVGAGLGGEVVARPPVADEAEGHIGARHRRFRRSVRPPLASRRGRCAGISAAPGWRRTGRGLLPASRRRGRRGGALPRRLPRPRATTRRRRRGRGSRSAAGRRRLWMAAPRRGSRGWRQRRGRRRRVSR